jgi:tetratricopeptide (TPR) repeat protein
MNLARVFRAVLGSLALLLLSLSSGPSFAQSNNQVAAESLFREARKLLDQGQYEQACEKLAASQRLDPAVGTLLNLGRCYEKLGRTASAWGAYREAAASAHASGQAERLKSARAAADAVEPKLARLTIVVPQSVSALQPTIERNGQPVPPELWGIAVPIDPGEQTIIARAPDKKPWTTRVSVEAKGAQTVTVAELEADPAAAAPAAPATAPVTTPPVVPPQSDTKRSSWNTQKTIAVVLAGVGVTGAAVGVIQGLKFKSKKDEADEICPGTCDRAADVEEALALRDDAKGARTVAIVGGAVGGASLIAAAVLWFTADSSSDSARLRWQPITTADTWGMRVSTQW